MTDEPREQVKRTRHELEPLTMRQMRFAMMCVTGQPEEHTTDDERAAACGWTEPGAGAKLRDTPEVAQLMRKIGDELRAAVISRAITNMPVPGVTLERVIEELWKVGSMPLDQLGRSPFLKTTALKTLADIFMELRSSVPAEAEKKDTRPVPKAAWQLKGVRPS